MSAARGSPSGAMRRVRLLASMRSNLVVVPALVCAGLVLGLALTHSGESPDQAVAREHASEEHAVEMPAVAQAPELPPDPAPMQLTPPAVESSGVAAPVAGAEAPLRHDPNAEPHETVTSTSEYPVYDESAVTLAEVHELAAEVSGASEADARAAALRQIDSDGVSSADSLHLLEQTLQTDRTVRNRLLAVNSLRQLGQQPANAERVRSALRAAMLDSDENVATSARDAYRQLTP